MAKILIIEDDVDQAELYRMALEHAGHLVVGSVFDLPEGKAIEGPAPDLVILDERLKGKSGITLIPRIRSEYPATRVLVLTADPDVAEGAREFGADEGRKKPLALNDLAATIKEMLGE